MRDFLQKVLDVDHYPMVLRDTIIVEPYIDAPAKVTSALIRTKRRIRTS